MDPGRIFSWDGVEPLPPDARYPGVRAKVVDGKNMQLVWAEFQPSSSYPLHAHEREQFSFMLSGRMRLTVGDEVSEVGAGDIWHAPSNVEHGGEILGDQPVVFVDVYSPPRPKAQRGWEADVGVAGSRDDRKRTLE